MKGYFITLEGTDGAGKSTQIALLAQYLISRGKKVLETREPGGTSFGEKIRTLLLDKENDTISDRCEVLLYAASRAQHVAEKIIPALNRGEIVICDRFLDSSIAYQGFGRGLGLEAVEQANNYALNGIVPQLTFYLDLSPEMGIIRKKEEYGHTMDRMEREELSFHQNVYNGYQRLCELYPDRIKRIDASLDAERIHMLIKEQINCILME